MEAAECYFRALRGSEVNGRFPLPLQPRRKLNDAGFVSLLAEVYQPGGLVRSQVIRVIEEVKEVGGKPQFDLLGDVEVLKHREVFVPLAGPEEEILRVPTEKVRDGGVTYAWSWFGRAERRIVDGEWQLVVQLRS